MEIDGHCDERFAAVREAFEQNFTERGDIGACFAVTLEGEYVVDLWGGYADGERSRPWQEDTIINVYSTTKTMTFLTALLLEDRGLLNLDDPVAKYWPEFAAAGKERVKVSQLLAHTAGLPGFSKPFGPSELYDWAGACADLAAQAPWWEPGTQSGYHAITQGYLIGEVVRRVTGQSFGQAFRELVAEPLGADFFVGVPEEHFGRIADLVAAKETAAILEMDPESITGRVFGGLDASPDSSASAAWRKAEIPAANGHGNARSVVRAQTPMANDGRAFGVELVSASTVQRALQPQVNGIDAVLGIPLQFAMGYARESEAVPLSPSNNVLWWSGAGGSAIVVDTEKRLCFSYVMNQMDNYIVGDPRAVALADALYESL